MIFNTSPPAGGLILNKFDFFLVNLFIIYMDTPFILAVSGPSGSGKGSVLARLKGNDDFHFSISATTRKPRGGEENGQQYYFLSHEEFEQKINNNEFIEWEEIFGNKYGTLKSEVYNSIEEGKNCVLEIDVEGVQNIQQIFDNVVSIFIAPPNIEELKKRLIKRNTETEASIETRMKRIKKEMEYSSHYDHIIINDDLDRAQKELLEILT